MSLLLKRNKANIFRIGHVKVFPGINEYTEEADIQVLKSHPSYQPMLDNGVHQEITKASAKKEQAPTTDISEMKAKDAISVIKETYSIPVLESMLEKEEENKSRVSVIEAVNDQIVEMRTPDPDPSDKDEDEE